MSWPLTVGAGERDALAADAGREQEGADALVLVELIHPALPLLRLGDAAVQPQVAVVVRLQHHSLDQAQHLARLREDQNAMPLREELRQQPVDEPQLAAALDHLLGVERAAPHLRAVLDPRRDEGLLVVLVAAGRQLVARGVLEPAVAQPLC